MDKIIAFFTVERYALYELLLWMFCTGACSFWGLSCAVKDYQKKQKKQRESIALAIKNEQEKVKSSEDDCISDDLDFLDL